jgi:hypothetical protein
MHIYSASVKAFRRAAPLSQEEKYDQLSGASEVSIIKDLPQNYLDGQAKAARL